MDGADQHGASGSSSQSFNFSSPTMQNQIHELAKTLPPPRKQNTACDACRARKVKCNQLPGQDKCQHCLSKNYPCTHFIQQATTEKKRNAAAAKRPRTLSTSSGSGQPSTSRIGPAEHMAPSVPAGPSHSYQPPGVQFAQPGLVPPAHPITTDTQTRDLLAYIFSPPESGSSNAHANGSASRLATPTPSAYGEWGALAHRLNEENFRIEFALDLVEVFFQIVHSRLPLLNPAQFRTRLHYSLYSTGSQNGGTSPNTPPGSAVAQQQRTRNSSSPNGGQSTHHPEQKPLHPALVATVIAWGAKFSEHPLFIADRHRNGGQSAFSKVLINRARDLAEYMKVHRIPDADHVVIALLIEPLQSQSMEDNAGFHGFWLGSAIRLLLDLQINHKSVMSEIRDPEARGTMIFAWWMACLADAYRSVYYRRKPMLDDDDYDIDFYTVGPVPPDIIESHAPQPSPREQLEFLVRISSNPPRTSALAQLLTIGPESCDQGYYRAAHALARIARQMSRQLWRPATESDGIPIDVLITFMNQLNEWRDEHLQHVGVPSNFEAEWDFVSAVTACASDATYHIMWIILYNALDDFGIREVNDVTRTGTSETLLPQHAQIEDKKRKVMNEALHGALRIAGLAGVLATNGYLKLDCAVMHVSCIQAGMLLAKLGRPEVVNCITGLEQYAYAYEECADQAAEIKRVYSQALNGEQDANHMSSVMLRVGGGGDGGTIGSNAMNVDQPMFGFS
ncbi:hypothetical protein L227DRAFT_651667 [Lentinus tigrinus ALCF2SS1-6]|uniref:Zn(2)-C6 fungal-type domain-containing protein n=1 Tax=Lentinus tigrinus ALCF2SS1-6 TaxID=1328759 RepID=A0A5C2SGK3_9APHY|nr:hypothetical protein L227DRAFT_651667 [Lentinus tigrinus ALCF2SS1-6]